MSATALGAIVAVVAGYASGMAATLYYLGNRIDRLGDRIDHLGDRMDATREDLARIGERLDGHVSNHPGPGPGAAARPRPPLTPAPVASSQLFA